LNLIDEIKNQNDQLLKKLIFFIPVNYLEGFKLFHDEVKKIPICKAIYTDGDEVKHDFIKFFLGFLRNNKKTKLLIGQHSFRSGLDDYDFYYDYVKSICSYYLTWGWKQKDSVIKNFGSLRIFNSLQKFENLNSDNLRKKSICFILCSYSTYGDCLYDNYFENINAEISRIDLLKNLRRDPELNIYLKPRSGSFLMRNKFKFYKNFNIMNEKTKLHNIYKKFEVIIFERISLGILECIYLDQPFIFYYPNNLYQHKNPKFKSLISLLKKSNLYINNIKDLKNLLNDKNRIIKWWNNKDNIFFRKKLIDNFGSKINKKHLNEIRKMVE
jgi:putative transferase (TIGR04331 family)